jgi:hypothetical protein
MLSAPRGILHHYFDVRIILILIILLSHLDAQETMDSRSEFGDDTKSAFSTMSALDLNTLGDISPDAL